MSHPTKHSYEFGKFRLDAGERLLLRDGEPVSLTPKAFDLLLVLVEHHGHLLEREELLKLVWPDTFVEEANLSYNVSNVRKALEENADGERFIETVPKRGYRFVANVVRVEADNPVTEEHSPVKGPAEEDTRARQNSTEAAGDPSPSRILIADIFSTAKPSNDPGFAFEALSRPSGALETGSTTESAGTLRLLKHERWMWIAATVLAGLTAFGIASYLLGRPAAEARLITLSALPPENTSFGHLAVSPDGQWLAFTAATGGKVQLWVGALDARKSTPLAGTVGAHNPFWSPDSKNLGFFAESKLKRVAISGEPPKTLCSVMVGTGGSWNRDGKILFSSLGGNGISLISDGGGDVTSVMRADFERGETDYSDPSFLPDGRHFFYFKHSGKQEVRGVYVASLDGRVNQRLLEEGSNAVYTESSRGDGYLLFGREGALMAQPFDARQLRFIDDPFSVAAAVGKSSDSPRRNFSVSENDVLVFDPLLRRQRAQLIWVDRAGRPTNQTDGPEYASFHSLSPDDRRIMVSIHYLGSNDLWLSEVTTGKFTPFTFNPATDIHPVWAPDGSRVVFSSNRGKQYDLYHKAASGEGQEELLHRSDYNKHPTDWSRDGGFIIYNQRDPITKTDVWALPMDPLAGDQKPFPFLQSEFNESGAVLSPDGHWMAYISDESERYEVYVQSFPGRGSKRRVSTDGGIGPRWRRDGKELYYHAPDGKLMAVSVQGVPSFELGTPVELFAFRPASRINTAYYSVARDGQRFLLRTIVDGDRATPLTVMVNWSAGLKR